MARVQLFSLELKKKPSDINHSEIIIQK